MSNDDCGEAKRHLYAYLDSELDEEAAAGIQAHLDDCPPCLHSFDFERRLKSVVQSRLNEEMPQDLLDKVRHLIRLENS